MGLACGDALGAPYEFGPSLATSVPVVMKGGGPFGFEPGEFTDDTSMAVAIALAIRAIDKRTAPDGSDAIDVDKVIALWLEWLVDTKDVGVQTGTILRRLQRAGDLSEAACRLLSEEHHNANGGQSAGNGALMRTAPIALAYLDDTTGLAEMARRMAQLTHWEETAGDACVLWCFAIVHAVRTGHLDIRIGLKEIPAERRDYWLERIDEAESANPAHFSVNNGWVVSAFRGAWSAIHHSLIESNGIDVVDALERAVRGGNDTDTVAAIAGSLVGAAAGAAVFPSRWRTIIHGWKIADQRELMALTHAATGAPPLKENEWPFRAIMPAKPYGTCLRHPHDDGVWLGSMDMLANLPAEVTAVVSLCRVGTEQVPTAGTDITERADFWLIDDIDANVDAAAVVRDAADTVARLRAEGHVVFLHCVAAHSRTPTVAAAYSALHLGLDAMDAHEEIRDVLPQEGAWRNPDFIELLRQI